MELYVRRVWQICGSVLVHHICAYRRPGVIHSNCCPSNVPWRPFIVLVDTMRAKRRLGLRVTALDVSTGIIDNGDG